MTTYRPEIDGLRALAVLPVILFHAGFEGFSGGFVGVDVFFVISGYLITSIIIDELSEDRFSLVRFYERRARRILPALFFMMAVCIPFAWLWLIPRDFKDFGESLAMVATFSSNILFWVESGYFATEASLKPLLHTWSLAVEEQYYIFFPLLMLAIWRFGNRWVFTILLLGLFVSLALAQWGSENKPSPTFYLLPTRGWELLIGALTALYLKRSMSGRVPPLALGEVVGLTGLAMIVASMTLFDETTPFPSVYALVPTIGTALIILGAVEGTWVARLLANKVPVTIGLMSYSAYLWHQPLLAFGHYQSLHEPSPLMMGTLVALTLPLAWFTWKYVEQPFRDKQRFDRRQIFTAAAVGATIFIVLGLGIRFAEGVPQRLSPEHLEIVNLGTQYVDRLNADTCNRHRYEVGLTGCTRGDPSNPIIALIGDSHASFLLHPLSAHLEKRGLGFRQYTKNGCPLAIGFKSTSGHRCAEFVDAAIKDIEARDVRAVIVAARWSGYLYEADFENGIGGREIREDAFYSVSGVPFTASIEVRRQAMIKAYVEAIGRLADGKRTVHVVMPVPEQGWDVPRYLGRIAINQSTSTEVPPSPFHVYQQRHAELMQAFAPMRQWPNVFIIEPATVLCNTPQGEGCISSIAGESLYYDDDHLTDRGAELLMPAILDTIDRAKGLMASSSTRP